MWNIPCIRNPRLHRPASLPPSMCANTHGNTRHDLRICAIPRLCTAHLCAIFVCIHARTWLALPKDKGIPNAQSDYIRYIPTSNIKKRISRDTGAREKRARNLYICIYIWSWCITAMHVGKSCRRFCFRRREFRALQMCAHDWMQFNDVP